MTGTSKIILVAAAAVILAVLVLFNFENLATWVRLNDPFQGQWVAVQLTDGEILYGHLAGVNGTIIGLKDVYVLDKFTPAPPASDTLSTSTDFSMGGAPVAMPQTKFVPVSDAEQLFIDRATVLYLKFLLSNDPALPYLQ